MILGSPMGLDSHHCLSYYIIAAVGRCGTLELGKNGVDLGLSADASSPTACFQYMLHRIASSYEYFFKSEEMNPINRKPETQLSPTNRATHFCKRNHVADLIKTRPFPRPLLPCRIWSFCVKGCTNK